MQELEKILEEIDNRVHFYDNADEPMMYVETVKDIIRKHMNDGRIPENKQPETCKYSGGSCCYPIDQCGECPKNSERSE